jgi:hypothetical protein
MTPEQATDKVYAATGVLLGTDKSPHIASYMTVMETRIAELEAALNKINKKDSYPNGGFGPFAEIARAALEGKGNE